MNGRTITDGQGPAGTGTRIPRGNALAVAAEAMHLLEPYVERAEIAGSLRRGREMVGDVDIVAIAKPGLALKFGQDMRTWHVGAAADFRAGEKMVSLVFGHGPSGLCGPGGRQEREAQVDVYFATEENWGMILCVRTGSAQHNVYMAKLAKSMGWKFAAGSGVLGRDGNVMGAQTEEEVFQAFGLLVPEPADREIVGGHPVWMK